jgi:hypothetical protein
MINNLNVPPGCRQILGGPDKDPDSGVPAMLIQDEDGKYAFYYPSTNGFGNWAKATQIGHALDAKANNESE